MDGTAKKRHSRIQKIKVHFEFQRVKNISDEYVIVYDLSTFFLFS